MPARLIFYYTKGTSRDEIEIFREFAIITLAELFAQIAQKMPNMLTPPKYQKNLCSFLAWLGQVSVCMAAVRAGGTSGCERDR